MADGDRKLRWSNDCLDFMTLGTSLRPIKASPLIYYTMQGALTVNQCLKVKLALSAYCEFKQWAGLLISVTLYLQLIFI